MDEAAADALLPALQTRCPGCGTTFRVSGEQLSMAGGRVRCGACERVFAAVEHRIDEDAAGDAGTGYVDDINQDYIAGLLSDAPLREAPAAANPALGQALPEAPVEIRGTADPRPFWRRHGWSAGVALTTLLLAAQYAWHERARLTQDLRYRHYYEQVCAVFACELPPYREPGTIRSDSLLIRAAPDRPGVLSVDAVFTNHSAYAQPWPDLEIRFSDLSGKLVAARVFTPLQYLAHAGGATRAIAAGASQHAHLEILDPGEDAVNYEIRLLDLPPAPP